MDDFKLNDDETMRRLRQISQSPEELQWRMELLSTLERMRIQSDVSNRNVMQLLMRMRKDISHITPVKIAELVNAQIEEKLKPRDQDMGRLWKAAMWCLEKGVTIGMGAVGALIGIKAMAK